jgi:hypothetical protein
MEYLELVRRQIVFRCLGGHIEKGEEIPKKCSANMEKAQETFGEMIRGLESMTSGLGYHLVEYLRETVEAIGFGSENYSREEIQKITGQVKGILKDLMRLEESPKEVYGDEKRREKLLGVCRVMEYFYTGKGLKAYNF